MESLNLIGSEQVQSAARQMREAAEEMLRAANTIAHENERQRQFMDQWLTSLVGAFEDYITMLRQS